MGEKDITPAQCRAARALLGWTREELAEVSGVSKMTLADFETGKRQPYSRTLSDIEEAFLVAGLILPRAGTTEEGGDGNGSGVRFIGTEDEMLSAEEARDLRKEIHKPAPKKPPAPPGAARRLPPGPKA